MEPPFGPPQSPLYQRFYISSHLRAAATTTLEPSVINLMLRIYLNLIFRVNARHEVASGRKLSALLQYYFVY